MVTSFLNYIAYERRLSEHTVKAYKNDLRQFASYLSDHFPAIKLEQANHKTLRTWIISLVENKISYRSINRKIASLKAFYKFLLKRTYIDENPTLKLKTLKSKRTLPSFIKEEELLKLLDHFEFKDTFEGWRDKLILELLYGTGIRLSELISLRESDINLNENMIKVLGKRNKERIIPFPTSLNTVIKKYNAQKSVTGKRNERLLVTSQDMPCYPMMIYRIVRKHLIACPSSDKHSPHVLRHTYATHLLNKGADLNAIKEMLGHESLSATQIYTHNTLDKLKEIFDQAHPKA
ncbi:MAG: tyrosine-type recombinase/integrase [Cytophagales bacterium]|nr:tyrosine-type recombinase/integrase [Cytophagales bacterium]